MATVRKFEDLEIWMLARELSKEIIEISERSPLNKSYRLKDQILGSSGSIMDNIAEGFERDGNLEFRQFLSIAKGSSGELRSQLYRLLDHSFITNVEFEGLKLRAEKLSGKISNFIGYLNKKDFKGNKFRTGE